MRRFDSCRDVLAVCATVLTLSACAGAQPNFRPAANGPIGTLASGPLRSDRQKSQMLPEATRFRRLLYVSDSGDNDVYVFSLPRGRLVGTLTGFLAVTGVCSDKKGHVFVVDLEAASIKEYRRGGKMPIAVLNDPHALPVACSVDPSTGNLAVTNEITIDASGRTEPGNVVVYPNGQGTPQTFSDPSMVYVSFDSYDDSGNLYVSGVGTSYADSAFGVLPKDGQQLMDLTLNQSICCDQQSALQWDGQYLAVASETDATIYQFKIKGTKGTKVGTIALNGASAVYGFWIQNHELYAPVRSNSQPMVGFYAYPDGGGPTKSLFGFAYSFGATVSLRP